VLDRQGRECRPLAKIAGRDSLASRGEAHFICHLLLPYTELPSGDRRKSQRGRALDLASGQPARAAAVRGFVGGVLLPASWRVCGGEQQCNSGTLRQITWV